MGSWGTESDACDDVMDEIAVFCDDEGNPKNVTVGQIDDVLKNIRNDNYNPTRFLGIVIWLVDHGQIPAIQWIIKAIENAKMALNQKDYLSTWNLPTKRKNALKAEIKKLKKIIGE